MLRSELTVLESFVLLQILDTAWMDHLYAMDQLKDSVGLRGYAEKDPRIEYKREGAKYFIEMQKTIRDRVTDLIFKARLESRTQMRNVYVDQEAQHETPVSGIEAAAAIEAQQHQGEDEQGGQEPQGPDSGPEEKRPLHKERRKKR